MGPYTSTFKAKKNFIYVNVYPGTAIAYKSAGVAAEVVEKKSYVLVHVVVHVERKFSRAICYIELTAN